MARSSPPKPLAEDEGIELTPQQLKRLVAIDDALDAAALCRSDELEQRRAQLAAAALSYATDSFSTVTTSTEAFEQFPSRSDRRFFAICLLRLLGRRREAFDDQRFRVPALKLFDDVLAADIYPLVNIDAADQGHDKLSALADAPRVAERDLEAAVKDAAQRADFAAARQELLRVLRSRRVSPIIAPFLPKSLCTTALEELLAAIQEFQDAEGEHLVGSCDQAKEMIERYLDLARSLPTAYSQRYCVALAEGLALRVDRRYESSAINKPANVSARLVEKKYPLHRVGAKLQILVEVTNAGPGIALDTRVAIEATDEFQVIDPDIILGTLSPRSIVVGCTVRVSTPSLDPLLRLAVEWSSADGRPYQTEEVLELEAQDPLINWDAARKSDPYALEPVSTEDALVGRKEILDKLESMMTGSAVGSAVIRGQKRVGKTSIARTLQSRLETSPTEIAVAYLEVGPYGGETVAGTIANLLPQICWELKSAVALSGALDVPAFSDGSAAPLIQFVAELRRAVPKRALLLVLDEFDELPPPLFGADDLARSFFMTLRAISNKPYFGVVLIGGEKMEFALSLHGDALNKFSDERVDYVSLGNNFNDFSELVRAPAQGVLEFTEEAVRLLHRETEGHPYFTKMICRSIWRRAVNARDAHITAGEIEEGIDDAVSTASATSFQHFWSDGIRGSAAEQATISLERRRLFIALSEALRGGDPTTEADIVRHAGDFNTTRNQTVAVLSECVQRDVLTRDGDRYATRIPFFGRWLKEFGPSKIGAQLAGSDVLVALKEREEELRVTAAEIKAVTDSWGTYRGVPVTPEDVRAWLEQFIGPEAQRLMFKILQGVRFYGGAVISEKLSDVHGAIMRGVTTRATAGLTRGDVLVSYLDGVGKSGAEIARKYRMVNQIDYDNVIDLASLDAAVHARSPRTIVFVDDFVSTGLSGAEGVAKLSPTLLSYFARDDVRVGFAVVAGFQTGMKAVQSAFRDHGIRARVHAGDTLGDEDRCFSPASRFFESEEERVQAEAIVSRIGLDLEKHHPLGYGDTQAAVVFEARCPNNSLPILWAERGPWHPLFPRH